MLLVGTHFIWVIWSETVYEINLISVRTTWHPVFVTLASTLLFMTTFWTESKSDINLRLIPTKRYVVSIYNMGFGDATHLDQQCLYKASIIGFFFGVLQVTLIAYKLDYLFFFCYFCCAFAPYLTGLSSIMLIWAAGARCKWRVHLYNRVPWQRLELQTS